MRHFAVLVGSLALVGCGVGFDSKTFGDGDGTGGSAGASDATGGSGGEGGLGHGGAGGVSPSTGGGGEGGQAPSPCHPVGLVDDFDDASLDEAFWNLQGNGSLVSLYGGALHIDPLPNVDGGQWAGVVTVAAYDVTECSVWIEAPQVVHEFGQGFTYFQLYHSAGGIAFEVTNGQLSMGVAGNGVTVTYDPTLHRWLRFREAAGKIYLETSFDGTSWVVGHSANTPDFANAVAVGIGRVSASLVSEPGTSVFDNLDVVP